MKFTHGYNFFTQFFEHFPHSLKAKNRTYTARHSTAFSFALNNEFKNAMNCTFANKEYYVGEKMLLMSGDIELNPGPVEIENIQGKITLPSHVVLEQRLQLFELRPHDVGGAGDCFFRAVSPQLYGDPSHHLDIRAGGIAYMRENPERFIESNTENSWEQYLNSMSMQGTWCDGLIIQAVADQLNLRIVITESHEHFRQFNFIQAVSSTLRPTDGFLGHLDEYHYVSTVPLSASSNLSKN